MYKECFLFYSKTVLRTKPAVAHLVMNYGDQALQKNNFR